MKRILFVDDEINILDGIRRMLYADRHRWEMRFALGGEAALCECERSGFDVVISDMRMPEMDGATLFRHIRDRFPNAARIILSGYSDGALATQAVSVAHLCLAKPCSAFEIQSAIERVCAMQEMVSAPGIRNLVGSVGQLPSLSNSYTHLTSAVADPNTSIDRVAEIIQQDIAMSAKVLQLTNSAFFGLAQRVTSLSGAVSFLGIETIKNLALVSEAFRVFKPDSRIPESFCGCLQEHAILTAAIAATLPVDISMRDTVAVASLLHDIGSLFLASAMPDELCSVLEIAAQRGCGTFEVEEELLGTSHAEIGAYLLGLWGLPSLAIEAIAYHHHPTSIQHSGFDCVVAVYVADLLAHEIESHPQGSMEIDIEDSVRDSLEVLGVLSRFQEFRQAAMFCRN